MIAISNDETGISQDPDVRYAVAKKIVERASGHGIPACDIVIDHIGKFVSRPPPSVGDPVFRMLLGLLDGGRCWVKLSAPYESSRVAAPTAGISAR